jgi:bacterioferritin-associated ferredoxin
MIVCHCASVTDSDISRLVRDGVSTVHEIVQRTGAGRRCAPCREEIATLLTQQQLIPILAD